jgi:hypothetical protein
MSVSAPLRSASEQVTGSPQRPIAHSPLAQSFDPRHTFPFTHRAQFDPPQSTSLSLPFNTTSVQLAGATQVPLTQSPSRQSEFPAHARPSEHRAHTAPPQSTSLSFPFLTASAQVGSRTHTAPLPHELLAQSRFAVQLAPSAQA